MAPFELHLLIGLACVSSVMALCTFKVGVLQSKEDNGTTTTAQLLADKFDMSPYSDYRVEFLPIAHPESQSYESVVKVHEYLKSEAIDVVAAPYHPSVSSAATQLQIPYIAMTIVSPEHRKETNIMVDLLPSFDDLALLVNHMAHSQSWGEIAIIYDGELGLPLIETLVRDKRIRLNAWKVPKHANETVLKSSLLDIRQALVKTLVLLCECDLSEQILIQAAKYSMLSSTYNWFLPYLNPYCIDYTPIQFSGINLTTLQIFEDEFIQNAPHTPQVFENATFRDAGRLLSSVFDRIYDDKTNCEVDRDAFYETLKTVQFEGDTGHVEFDDKGKRIRYVVSLVALRGEGWFPYASWNSTANHHNHVAGFELKLNGNEISDEYPFGKKVVRVVTMLESPFVQIRSDVNQTQVDSPNDMYEGYCIDLLKKLAEKHNFQYEIYLPRDMKWGDELPNGSWTGVMGELISHRADMAVTSLTITADRENVIDFSKPFKNRGLSILMKKQQQKTSFFQFLEPLSDTVWLMVFIALVVVSVVLYALDRIHVQEMERRFDMMEAVWFSYGALVQSGTEVLPKTLSARILTSAWWFFSLILISSYTANLAAFLTVSKFNTPIKDVNDLVGQSTVEYGTVADTQVYQFFERSKVEYFHKIGNYMRMINPTAMVSATTDGVERVRKSRGDYAFIWDDPVIKYQTIMDCTLIEIGRPFDSKGYGVGVPRGAPYRDVISMSILQLNEGGELSYLDKKWWAHNKCDADPTQTKATNQELTLEMVSGVFFLLGAGIAVSLLVCVVQLCLRRKQTRNNKKKTHELPVPNATQPLWNSTVTNNVKTTSQV